MKRRVAVMQGLTRDFLAYAESKGIQKTVILSQIQVQQLAKLAPEAYRKNFEQACSDDYRDIPVIVLMGVFGYDDLFATVRNQREGIGLTGSHQNYWRIAEEAVKNTSQFLEGRGFRAKPHGEFNAILPVKYVLNRLGVGKYGKNSIIYIDGYGSYLNNWVELFTNAPLELTDIQVTEDFQGLAQCVKCETCVSTCPTSAILEPYKVDQNKCITHLTHRTDTIPKELFSKMRNWIWGCNICQNICPANARVAPRKRPVDAAISHPGTTGLPPAHKHPFPRLATELVPEYNTKYLKNVLIALGNCGVSDDLRYVEMFSRTSKGGELKEFCDYALSQIRSRHETEPKRLERILG